MDGTKATRKTIGEVEKLTGIPKRDLKYYIEQNIMRPSHRAENGYWLYNDEDIRRAQLAALCQELGFPGKVIRTILADPASHWQGELERHIDQLEVWLRASKRVRHRGPWEALQIYYGGPTEKHSTQTK